ncbi:MAG: tetratricopeptide repeat protein [Calditrichia bacterium]
MGIKESDLMNILSEARRLYEQKSFTEAIRRYREAADHLKEDADNLPIVQIELGWSYYAAQQYREAVRVFQKALASGKLDDQQKFDVLRLCGFSLELSGDWQQAHDYLDKALRVEIAERIKRFTYFEMGKLLFIRGKISEAEQFLQTAEDLFEDDEPDYLLTLNYYMGFSRFFQGNYKEARRRFDFIIQNAGEPEKKVGGYFGLAHLHFKNKEYPALLDLTERILLLDPEFYDRETLAFFSCEAFFHLNKWEDLERFFREMVQRYPHGRYFKEYAKFQAALDAHRQNPDQAEQATPPTE